jgi:WD40 repeat protein
VWKVSTAPQVPCFSGVITQSPNKPSNLLPDSYIANLQNITVDNAQSVQPLSILEQVDGIIREIALSNDGTLLAVGEQSGQNRVTLWDLNTLKSLGPIQSHNSIIATLAFSPDDHAIVSGSWDKTAQIWDIALNEQLGTLSGFPYYVTNVRFSPDGTKLFTTSSKNSALQMWDAGKMTVLKSLVQGGDINTMDLSSDGNCIIAAHRPAGTGDGYLIKLIDVTSGSEAILPDSYSGSIAQLVFSADGKLIASASNSAGLNRTARIWDFARRAQLKVFQHSEYVTSVAFNPDVTILATASGDIDPDENNRITLWNIATEQPIKILEGHKNNITKILFTSDGKLIISAGYDGTLRLWGIPPDSIK